jgi:predicted NBD/HSP70 family sugar kinase
VINQRVEEAIAAGILIESEEAVSTGGRPSKVLRLNPSRGLILSAVFGASRLHVSVNDLTGRVLADDFFAWDIERGPEASLERMFRAADALVAAHSDRDLWAGTVGLPGPVDHDSGRPVTPPIMPGWDGFPVRRVTERHFGAPIWVDNDVNIMTLGAWHETRQAAGDNILLIKAGTGIGAGLISRGRLHRGANGAAGDFGHIAIDDRSPALCRCGNFGCLEAYAGGWAVARDALDSARSGESSYLRDLLLRDEPITIEAVITGSNHGDRTCRELMQRAGTLIGRQLATMVSFFNPSTVFISGSMIRTGPVFLEPLTEQVRRRAMPLAAAELVIREAPLQHYEGVIGGGVNAVDEILAPRRLAAWLPSGSPRSLAGADGGFSERTTLFDRLDLISKVERAASATLPEIPLITHR